MYLSFWADHFGDEIAVVDGERRRSWRELNADANRLVRALRAAGIGEGSGVGVMARNCYEWAVVMGAVERSGLVFVPINWHLSAEEVAYIAGDAELSVLFHDLESTDVAREAAELAHIALTICSDRVRPGEPSEFEQGLEGRDPSDVEDPIFGTRMAYTSGTTGHPKAVYRPREVQRDRAVQHAAAKESAVKVHYTPGAHRHLATGPLYHGGPGYQSLVAPLHAGVPIVLMRSWDSREFLRLVEEHRITHAHMAPIMFRRLLRLDVDERRSADLSSLVQLRHGGAPCPVQEKQAMLDWLGPVIDEYYGSTEGAVVSIAAADWIEHPGSVGRAAPGQIKILDDDGNEVPPLSVGTIHVRATGNLRFEYRGAPDKTRAAHRGDYYTVGDVGYLDNHDWLYLTDRSVDLILSGGVNIYPAEIEAVLAGHPAVRDCAVVGVPDAEWGEQAWAAIEPLDPDVDWAGLEAELRARCLDRLARFKCPRRFILERDLPREDSGKLFKRRLRDRYRAELASGSEATC